MNRTDFCVRNMEDYRHMYLTWPIIDTFNWNASKDGDWTGLSVDYYDIVNGIFGVGQ